jgi:hypothetical protein
MRRTKPRLLPSMDVMEPRSLLSAGGSLASARVLTRVDHLVKSIVTSLAKTDDIVQANANLASLASQVAPTSPSLAVSWQSDVALFRPGSPKSKITTQQRIIDDLRRLLHNVVPAGTGTVTGAGSTTAGTGTGTGTGSTTSSTPTPGTAGTSNPSQGDSGTSAPVPAPSLDSVQIQNQTGLALKVTVFLDDSQNPLPFITETISSQGDPTELFNFGTSTGAFMTMNISRADGLQSPAPFDNIQLSQPLGGYAGTLFSISLLGPYFNVNFS